ncbi:MAG: hypothetical protein NC131_03530 [Roseburia sp.]|nr:hypothetical protein [Roseburia sp.]
MGRLVKTTVIKSDDSVSMRIFNVIVGVAAFCTMYLTLFSALPLNPAYYVALPVGGAVAALFLAFGKNKFVRWGLLVAAALFTVLSAAAGFNVFKSGLLEFFNAAVKSLNANRHYGFQSFVNSGSFGASVLFSLNVSVWFALFTAVAVKKQYVFICAEALLFVFLLCFGLYPHYYTAVMLVPVLLCLLAVHNGFSLRAALAWLACACVVCAVTVPCYFYKPSDAIERFGNSVSDAVDDIIYGKSLPNGKLSRAGGMSGSGETRLKLTLSAQTPTLYLKGFVGGEFNGSDWKETDKNVYVQNGYQGLIDYVNSAGMPVTQYSRYVKLGGVSSGFNVTVENVSADRRYVYAPYTVSAYNAGKTYYDMGLRGNLSSPRTYSYTVFAADVSGERVIQADWLTQNSNLTAEMREYVETEGQYRSFVYDVYLNLGEAEKQAAGEAIGEFSTTSVNTATQFIRSYFLDSFAYSDKCDPVGENFTDKFFGGKIVNANSAYFATAATLMFRSMGFASRYVEGYFVNCREGGATGESLSVNVTGESTHAWSEVYFDGIGWLPIEVTPTFFSERAPDVTVVPDDSDAGNSVPSDSGEQPELPPENSEAPDKPVDIPPENQTKTANSPLLTALKVLLPIVSVIAVCLFAVLALVLRRQLKRMKRVRALSGDGENFGRTAYDILVTDCRRFGGFEREVMEKYGISDNATEHLMRILERCVYGAYTPTENDRKFVLGYIEDMHEALMSGCGFFRKIYYRYILCLVI